MKTTQLLNEWENLGGQIRAFSFVKDLVGEGTSIPSLLEKLAKRMKAIDERKDQIEDELEPHMRSLLADLGLRDAVPEMQFQWQSFAVGRDIPNLIRELATVKEAGIPLE